MHKKKTSNKYSKKTRKNKNVCKKGITDEVIKLNKFINEIKKRNKSNKKELDKKELDKKELDKKGLDKKN